MRRTLLPTCAFAGLIIACAATPARADPSDWGFRIGVGGDVGIGFRAGDFRIGLGVGVEHRHAHRQHHRHGPARHYCAPAPVYDRVWVAPVYRTVVVGRDHCGRPIVRSVLARAGFHRQVLRGRRCSCGRFFG